MRGGGGWEPWGEVASIFQGMSHSAFERGEEGGWEWSLCMHGEVASIALAAGEGRKGAGSLCMHGEDASIALAAGQLVRGSHRPLQP